MRELSFCSWNVRYFSHRLRGLRATDRGVSEIARAIATRLPDIVALQEVETRSLRGGLGPKHQIDRLLNAISEHAPNHRYTAAYFPAHHYGVSRGALMTTGLAILVGPGSRIFSQHAQDITHRRFAATRHLKQTRLCAHVTVQTESGPTIDVFNTHLSLPAFLDPNAYRPIGRMGSAANQRQEASNLTDYVNRRVTSNNVLLSGDFNSLPGSQVYEHVLANTPLRDAVRDHLGVGVDELHERPTAGFGRSKMHIDYVFSRGLNWQRFDHHDFGQRGPFDGLSDHVPRWGTFRIPAR